MSRFIRPVVCGASLERHWEVWIDGYVRGTLWMHTVAEGVVAYAQNVYGESERVREDGFRNIVDAARAVAKWAEDEDRYRADEAEAEMYAEFGMGYVCSGGNPADVSLAWQMSRENF